MFKGRSGFGPG